MKYLAIFAFLFAGCATTSEKKHYVYSDKQLETVETSQEFSRIYELSTTPNYELEKKFENILEEASLKVFALTSSHYSYSISPYGAVYPFSKVKVTCLFASSLASSEAKNTCLEFFKEIETKLAFVR